MASENLFEALLSDNSALELDNYVGENVEPYLRNVLHLGSNIEVGKSHPEHSIKCNSKVNEILGENRIAKTQDLELKLFRLPISRIRNLMKLDPDLSIASGEALFAVTRSTELFIASLACESYSYTAQAQKRTVQKRDVDSAISAVDSLMFLQGAVNY